MVQLFEDILVNTSFITESEEKYLVTTKLFERVCNFFVSLAVKVNKPQSK